MYALFDIVNLKLAETLFFLHQKIQKIIFKMKTIKSHIHPFSLSHTIFHPTLFQPYTLPIIHSNILPIFQYNTLLHSYNLQIFQSNTLTLLQYTISQIGYTHTHYSQCNTRDPIGSKNNSTGWHKTICNAATECNKSDILHTFGKKIHTFFPSLP